LWVGWYNKKNNLTHSIYNLFFPTYVIKRINIKIMLNLIESFSNLHPKILIKELKTSHSFEHTQTIVGTMSKFR